MSSVADDLAGLFERDILIMRFFGEMNQTQIGQRLGISQMQVSRLLTASLTQLREALNDDTPSPTPAAGQRACPPRRKHGQRPTTAAGRGGAGIGRDPIPAKISP